MKPTHHVIISVGVTAFLAIWVKSWAALLACFLSGILIDLDHYLDYIMVKKRIPWRYQDLLNYLDKDLDGKFYFYFHSYEFLFLLWFAIVHFQLADFWVAIAVGLTTHMIADQIFNPFRPFSYFLFFRIRNNFERRRLFTQRHIDENF